MTPHTCTTLTKGCYRCELSLDEMEASHRESLAVAADILDRYPGGGYDDPAEWELEQAVDALADLHAIVEYYLEKP